jgi:uncharacterized protein (TIGR03382 family)
MRLQAEVAARQQVAHRGYVRLLEQLGVADLERGAERGAGCSSGSTGGQTGALCALVLALSVLRRRRWPDRRAIRARDRGSSRRQLEDEPRCPGFVRSSDEWPNSGRNPDSPDRDLARLPVAQRLLSGRAWSRRAVLRSRSTSHACGGMLEHVARRLAR